MSKESAPDPAAKYFSCTSGERAAFEAGIKLGLLCHQFSGTPLSPENVESLERTMEKTALALPCVESVKVNIDRTKLKSQNDSSYIPTVLLEGMLDITITTSCGGAKATARMRYIEEMDFPLMYVERIE